jgi:hypothetical protein
VAADKNVKSNMSVITWLDPGGTTGIATWTPDPGTETGSGEFRSRQEDFRSTGNYLNMLMRDNPGTMLGYEQYNITPGRYVKHDGSSLMVIGMARWLALVHGAVMLPSQPPSARKLGMQHLKTLGWYRPGLGHANDAAGHLLVWLLKENLLPEELKEKLRGNSRD